MKKLRKDLIIKFRSNFYIEETAEENNWRNYLLIFLLFISLRAKVQHFHFYFLWGVRAGTGITMKNCCWTANTLIFLVVTCLCVRALYISRFLDYRKIIMLYLHCSLWSMYIPPHQVNFKIASQDTAIMRLWHLRNQQLLIIQLLFIQLCKCSNI